MITLLLSLLLAAAPCGAAFCRCIPITPEEAAARADAVFTATVVHVQVLPPREPGRPALGHRARMRVHAAWKGVRAPEVVIESGMTSCAFDFRAGDHYLIYGRVDSAGVLHASQCSGSGRTEPGTVNVAGLGAPQRTWPRPGAD